jgi:hypothetical protein
MFIQRGNNNFEIEIVNAPPFTNTYSTSFDGMDDYVDTNSTKFSGASEFSISMWANFSSLSGNNPIVSNWFTGVTNYIVRYSSTKLQFYISTTGGVAKVTEYTFTPTLGIWYNIICVYNGSNISIYINGNPQGTPTAITGTVLANTNNCLIGERGTEHFSGIIDEVAYFDTALTPTEITSISAAPTDLADLSPVAWYRMGDNGSYKSPQWLLPSNENKDKVSNYSLSFDGIDNYVSVNPNALTDFTVSFWINPSSGVGASYDGILGQGTTSPQGGILRYVAYDGTAFIGSVLVFLGSWTNVSGTVTNGVWTNIVLTYDSVADELKGYNNGSPYITISNPNFSAQTTNAHSFERIGLRNGLSGSEFNGNIDEVALWDSALTDISSIYNGGTPTTLPSGAVAHWRMGEDASFNGTNWTVPDQVGSNDGTSNAMTIEDRVGDAPSSENNALSFNMDLVDRVIDTP